MTKIAVTRSLPAPLKRKSPYQIALPGISGLEDAVAQLAEAGIEERGAIFTKREVVDFILDLVGYTPDRPLHAYKILEPSFGDGDFLFPIVERLIESRRKRLTSQKDWLALGDAIRGVELHITSFLATQAKLIQFLVDRGCAESVAAALAKCWLSQQDFLLSEHSHLYSYIVGNPPYVRQEMVADTLMAEYRARFTTIYDRADLYVPFIEHSLSLLAPDARLAFICADRWMKNKYGGPLRKLVADRFHFCAYVDMVDTDAFHSDVIAYPAIFTIANEKPGPTRVAHRPPIEAAALRRLAKELTLCSKAKSAREIANVAVGSEPWILDSLDQLAVIRRLERDFPALEDAGCKVGIGVATGNDDVFIAPFDTLDVEPERKLPLVTTRDILNGTVQWRGLGVLNPFLENGKLAPLDQFPKFARYLEVHGEVIRRRHVSQKNPGNWYRTIDRIYPALMEKKKLVIPDIKGEANIVFESGKLYPHHNLYYITSDEWDLMALRAVLRSGIAKLFISTYSTKMRGGYLRYQAQYLRRIRVPRWSTIPKPLQAKLKDPKTHASISACNAAVAKLYDLTQDELALISDHSTARLA